MIRLLGSAAGPAPIPGLTSDGNDGIRVAKGVRVGDTAATGQADYLWVRGAVEIDDVAASYVDLDTLLFMNQGQPVPAGAGAVLGIDVNRGGDISAGDYAAPLIRFHDHTASTRPVLEVRKQNALVLQIGGTHSVTGALSSVTDANAKAVLTSIIAVLTGISVATDGTT